MNTRKKIDIIRLKGKVVDGLGKGAFFLSKEPYKSFFKGILGEDPFPGTLNVKLDKPWTEAVPSWNTFQPAEFGGISYVLGKIGKLRIVVLRPHKSKHPPEILEIVSSKYLRKEFNLVNGNIIEFEVYL